MTWPGGGPDTNSFASLLAAMIALTLVADR